MIEKIRTKSSSSVELKTIIFFNNFKVNENVDIGHPWWTVLTKLSFLLMEAVPHPLSKHNP